MTSPYLDSRVQKYDPGSKHTGSGKGTVEYAQTLLPYNSDGVKVGGYQPKPTPLSGMGKIRDNRKEQNPGFTLGV